MKARVPASPSATSAGVFNAAPRPGTSCSGFNAAIASIVFGQSSKYASPAYGVAPNSTRSPASIVFSCGSHTTVSPFVWPRPSCISLISSLPSHSVISPLKVIVGHVSPGTLSTDWNSRGKRPISLFMSASPRSTIRS
jgi:hypothetical protein